MRWIMMDVPQFGNDENVFAFQLTCRYFLVHGFPNFLFVFIEICGINVTITALKRYFCRGEDVVGFSALEKGGCGSLLIEVY